MRFTVEPYYKAWMVREYDEDGTYRGGWGFGSGADALLNALDKLADILLSPRCVECLSPQVLGYVDERERHMREHRLCFGCSFWIEKMEDRRPEVFYADGCRYTILPDPPKGFRGFVGHGGAEFRIRFNDGREVVSRNLWTQGVVPKHFRERMPDTAIFLRREHGNYHGEASAGCQ